MKRTLPYYSDEDLPRKRQNTSTANPFGSSTYSIDKDKNVASSQTNVPRIPHEVVYTHIVPQHSLSWLFVSKKCHRLAFANLPNDPRLDAKFSNPTRTLIRLLSKENTRALQLLLNDQRVDVSDEIDDIIPQQVMQTDSYEIIRMFTNNGRISIQFLTMAIYWASDKGYLDLVIQLINDSRLKRDRSSICEGVLSTSSHAPIIRYILQNLPNDKFRNGLQHALGKAVTKGYYFVVDELIQHGHDPSQDSNIALRLAAQHGHYEIVKLLLKCSTVDPMDRKEHDFPYYHPEVGECQLGNAIESALFGNHLSILHLLLDDPRSMIDDQILKYWEHLLPL